MERHGKVYAAIMSTVAQGCPRAHQSQLGAAAAGRGGGASVGAAGVERA